MKKLFVVLAVSMLAVFLVACGGDDATPAANEQAEVQVETQVQEEVEETEQEEVVEQEQEVPEVPAAVTGGLVGTWDWEGMPAAIVLDEDGSYSWLGVDYGALGFRWSSDNGVVSFGLGAETTEWFTYEFIDDNTMDIEYVATLGEVFRMHRAQ